MSERVPDETIMAYVYAKVYNVEGVYGIGLKKTRGVRVIFDEEKGYIIDIYLIADFGANIPETAWNVQKSVYDGLKDDFGIEPEDINIHVQGVHAN